MKMDSTAIVAFILIAFVFILNFGIFIWSGAFKYAMRGSAKYKKTEDGKKEK